VLAALTAIMCAVLALAPREMPASKIEEAQIRVALSPMLIVVVSYCLFSVGTIAYMTFMIAWLAKAGAGATTQAVFWSLLGLGGICSPFLWSWAIAVLSGGRAVAMLTALSLRLQSGYRPICGSCNSCLRSCLDQRCSRSSRQPPHSCARIIRPPHGPAALVL
jgi:hypothetical protein